MATLNFDPADGAAAQASRPTGRVRPSEGPSLCLLARLLIWCTRNAR